MKHDTAGKLVRASPLNCPKNCNITCGCEHCLLNGESEFSPEVAYYMFGYPVYRLRWFYPNNKKYLKQGNK